MNGAWHLLQAAEQLAQRDGVSNADSSNTTATIPLSSHHILSTSQHRQTDDCKLSLHSPHVDPRAINPVPAFVPASVPAFQPTSTSTPEPAPALASAPAPTPTPTHVSEAVFTPAPTPTPAPAPAQQPRPTHNAPAHISVPTPSTALEPAPPSTPESEKKRKPLPVTNPELTTSRVTATRPGPKTKPKTTPIHDPASVSSKCRFDAKAKIPPPVAAKAPARPLGPPEPPGSLGAAAPKRKRLRDDLQERLDGCQIEVRSLAAEKSALQDRCKAAEEAISRRNCVIGHAVTAPAPLPLAASVSGGPVPSSRAVSIPPAENETRDIDPTQDNSPGGSNVSANPEWSGPQNRASGTGQLTLDHHPSAAALGPHSQPLQQPQYAPYFYNCTVPQGASMGPNAEQHPVPGGYFQQLQQQQMVMGFPPQQMVMGAPHPDVPYYVYNPPPGFTRP